MNLWIVLASSHVTAASEKFANGYPVEADGGIGGREKFRRFRTSRLGAGSIRCRVIGGICSFSRYVGGPGCLDIGVGMDRKPEFPQRELNRGLQCFRSYLLIST